MKKILLIVSLIAICSLNGNSQERSFNFGLKMGPNLAWANAPSAEAGKNLSSRIGFSAGLFVDSYFTKNFAFSTGLNFNILGMNYQFTDRRHLPNFVEATNISVDRTFSGTYLELPLKFKMKFEVADALSVFADAGVGIGLNLSDKAKDVYSFYGINYSDPEFVNVTNEYRRLQVAMKFDLGAAYQISNYFSVFAQLAFHHSFSNMFTYEMKKETGVNLKSNFIGLELGIMY